MNIILFICVCLYLHMHNHLRNIIQPCYSTETMIHKCYNLMVSSLRCIQIFTIILKDLDKLFLHKYFSHCSHICMADF